MVNVRRTIWKGLCCALYDSFYDTSLANGSFRDQWEPAKVSVRAWVDGLPAVNTFDMALHDLS